MRISLILLFLFTIVRCSSPSVTKEVDHADSTMDTIRKVDSVLVPKMCEFDYHKFKITADSLLAIIVNKPDTFRVDIDTLIFSHPDKTNFFYPLVIQNGICHRYFFEPPRKSSYYHFWMVTAEFPDSSSAAKAFDELHKRSRDEEPRDELMPGLTYENDYLLRSGDKIYWLNTGCVYGGPVNNILKCAFRSSTCKSAYDDSILVYCGDRARN